MADEEKVVSEEEENAPAEQSKEEPLKVSRRDFLIGAGAGVVATGAIAGGYIALAPKEQVEVAPEAAVAPQEGAASVEMAESELPATVRAVTLNIDGQSHDVIVDVRESLWETMTNTLGLGDSLNLGCDRAQCGACAILVDGRAVNGCTILSARMGRGQEIVSVNGLTTGGQSLSIDNLHPIQRAFWQEGGFQCGICTRGFIMATYDLLSRIPDPTEEDVREALAGNICRCSEYPKIYDSVFKAAEEMRGA